MKNSLVLLPVFFVALLVSFAVCPFLYSLSRPESFAAIAAGDAATFFVKNLQNALAFAPSGIVIAFTAVFVYIARHKMEGLGSLVILGALLLFSIAALEPIAARLNLSLQLREAARPAGLEAKGARAALIEEREPGIKSVALQGSAGVVRPVLVVADTSGMADGRALNVHAGQEAASIRSSSRGSALDLQIAQKLEETPFLSGLSRDISAVHAILFDAASYSVGAYIWTALPFFVLAASFFFLCVLTDWKLINFTLYAVALRALYWLFPLLHGEAGLSFLGRFLPRFLSDAALAALPLLLIAAVLLALGFALILPKCIRRNLGGHFL